MTEDQPKENSSQQHTSRRTALKYIGSTGVLSTFGIPRVVSAESNDGQLRKKSLKLRKENDWSVTEWREYLVDEGAQIMTADKDFSIPSLASTDRDEEDTADKNKEGTVEPKELEHDKCKLKVTYGWGHYSSELKRDFDFAWEIETDDNIIADTAGPADLPTIGWSDNHYLKDGDIEYGEFCSDPKKKESTRITGAVAQYKVAADGELTKAKNPNASSWTLGSFINIPVQVVDGSKEDERRIEVDYFHRYGVVNFNGISWNGGIPSLSFGIGEESWVREAEPTENEMDNTYVDKP